MPITQDTITTVDGTCTVTVATPDGTGPWPAVVMFPDAGGLRPTFDQMAAQLAGFGYVVLVPDVYYRTPGWGGPFDLNTVFTDQEQRKQLFELMGTLTPKIFAADAEAFFDYLAARPDVAGDKFGTTGYCMGGRASLIVATRVPERVAAALSFHGGRLAVEDDPDSRICGPTRSPRSSMSAPPRTTPPSPPTTPSGSRMPCPAPPSNTPSSSIPPRTVSRCPTTRRCTTRRPPSGIGRTPNEFSGGPLSPGRSR